MSPALPPLPPVQHLGLGAGESHRGLYVACAVCAAYLRAHPQTATPSGAEKEAAA